MGYTIWPGGITGDVVALVYKERMRQLQLVGDKFPFDASNKKASLASKLTILAEEFGEVSREVNECTISLWKGKRTDGHKKKLREELIQVAAVAVAWAESL